MQLSKTKFSVYASLGSSKMRKKHGLFTVEGTKAVSDILESFELEALLVSDPRPEVSDAFERKTPGKVYCVSQEEMKRLSNFSTSSNLMGVFRHPGYKEAEGGEIGGGLYVVLDGVRDPGNFGTIIRSCHWFGIQTVFASEDSVDLYNPKTVQASMGSLGKVEVVYCDIVTLLRDNRRLPAFGLVLDGENIYKAPLGEQGFIIMGNEGEGISERVRAEITHPLLIPPGGPDHSESLNVGVATAVTLSQFRQRQCRR